MPHHAMLLESRIRIPLARSILVRIRLLRVAKFQHHPAVRRSHVTASQNCRPEMSFAAGSPSSALLGLEVARPNGNDATKRLFDLLVATACLVCLAPFLALIAVIVVIDTPGPPLFRQIRRGRGDVEFSIFKLRTMYAGAEGLRHHVDHLNQTDAPLFKIKDGDPRVTRVGAVLRRTSIDELPQLLNVIRGDMSLVGPRPLIPSEADSIARWVPGRSSVKPGLAGPWQAAGRTDLTLARMVELDSEYARRTPSVALDARIFFASVLAALRRRGAY